MIRGKKPHWGATAMTSIREHITLTQHELSQELGVRQQTVSEWETGRYCPRGSAAKLLNIVAERSGFAYDADERSHDADERSYDADERSCDADER